MSARSGGVAENREQRYEPAYQEADTQRDEQFYVSRDSPSLSIGGIRNRLHEAIAKRVHHRAQDVASARPLSSPPSGTAGSIGTVGSVFPNRRMRLTGRRPMRSHLSGCRPSSIRESDLPEAPDRSPTLSLSGPCWAPDCAVLNGMLPRARTRNGGCIDYLPRRRQLVPVRIEL